MRAPLGNGPVADLSSGDGNNGSVPSAGGDDGNGGSGKQLAMFTAFLGLVGAAATFYSMYSKPTPARA